jgi:tRNA-methyltransferase O
VPAAGQQTVVVQASYGLVPIGWVQSALRGLDDAPNQHDGAPRACIRNPIGLHRARIVARDGLRIEVDALEAIDGTPVVDAKPAIDPPA